jgi:hypothetical protein
MDILFIIITCGFFLLTWGFVRLSSLLAAASPCCLSCT